MRRTGPRPVGAAFLPGPPFGAAFLPAFFFLRAFARPPAFFAAAAASSEGAARSSSDRSAKVTKRFLPRCFPT